jgi:hypothetical protein
VVPLRSAVTVTLLLLAVICSGGRLLMLSFL